MSDELPISGNSIERVLIEQMMDVENSEPIMHRLKKMNVSPTDLAEIAGNPGFEEELYTHCKGAILLPAMSKILNSLISKATGGSIQAQRTYLELMKRLNTKIDVNVNLLQYQGLSDSELDRRIQTEMSKHGLGQSESLTSEPFIEGEIADEARGDEEGEGGTEA